MPVTDAARAAGAPLPVPPRVAFMPRRWLGNGHLMTVVAWASQRRFPDLPEPEARLIQVSDDTQVLAHIHWQPVPEACPTVVALHGLEGSSSTHYIRGLADKAWRRGWNIVRLNQRNCGGTEHLTPGLYHSGLTSDPLAVIRTLTEAHGLRDVGVVGYSLGGNLAMKIAGELADDAASPLRAVVAVCPTMDLARCVRSIERRSNFIYEYNFVRNLKRRMRRKAEAWPDRFDLGPLDGIRSIRAFDDLYTAPHHGFGDAETYYHRASSLRVADRIRRPALVLAAGDDPFVPAAQFEAPALADNPHVQAEVTRHGGHCGFLAAAGDDDGFWAETRALDFLAAVMPGTRQTTPPGRS